MPFDALDDAEIYYTRLMIISQPPEMQVQPINDMLNPLNLLLPSELPSWTCARDGDFSTPGVLNKKQSPAKSLSSRLYKMYFETPEVRIPMMCYSNDFAD